MLLTGLLLLPAVMSLGTGSMLTLRPPETEDKDEEDDTANDEGAKCCPKRPSVDFDHWGLAEAKGLKQRSHSDAIATKENLSLLKDIKQK